VGGGAMGSGIAALVARKVPVVVKEMNEELAEKAISRIDDSFKRALKAGRIEEEHYDRLRGSVAATANWADLSDVNLLIEAVPENMELKKEIFATASLWLPPDAILASNTSALSISEMAEKLTPERHPNLLGLHFFNPPTKMQLVEVIAAQETSKEVFEEVEDFARSALGKKTIRVKECPGFLVNRLLMPYLNEAVYGIMNTELNPMDIDEEATKFGWPVGPFFLMDSLGLDVCAEVADTLCRGYGERVQPSPLLRKLVDLGRLGQKTGVGFYGGDKTAIEVIEEHFPWARHGHERISAAHVFEKMMTEFAKEAALAHKEGIASAEDIETGCLYGIGFPMAHEGPLHWAQANNLLEKPIFETI
ncbi:MAG: 3-hydroxyacyl-CoA dehydrogenase NAD-binding domain-containing protein, partial [Nanoarchaeota archaeon]